MDFDPYQILGVTPETKEGEAKKIYRKLARQYHPDRAIGNIIAEIKFKAIQRAWDEIKDKLPNNPVPLDIPEGASDEEIEELYAAWLLHPSNTTPEKPTAQQEEAAQPPGQDRNTWATVASEAGNALTPASVRGDWTKVRIARGRAGAGLEYITADEAAHLIYSRPHAFAMLKIVQQHNPELCLYDAILFCAKGSIYKPPSVSRGAPSTALVIRGTERVNREDCTAALRGPFDSIEMVGEIFHQIAQHVQFQGTIINPDLLKLEMSWLIGHIRELIEKCANRRVNPRGDGGTGLIRP
jgi:hypothetical protein